MKSWNYIAKTKLKQTLAETKLKYTHFSTTLANPAALCIYTADISNVLAASYTPYFVCILTYNFPNLNLSLL